MHKKISIILISILLCASFLLVSCNANGTPSVITPPKDKVISGELSGGDASLGDDVNLQNISLEQQGEKTVVTMYFLNGSRVAGVNESKISSVPKYSAQLLGAPYRLKVDLTVGFSDYARNSETYSNSVLYGLFSTIHSGDNSMSVFLQLNENVEATVREDADKLVFTLSPKASFAQKDYYVGLNAYEAYEQNLIPEDAGLMPTMCEGLKDIMLISKPLHDEAAAKKLAEEVNVKIASAVPAKKAYWFEMSTDELPKYNKDADTKSVKEEPVILKDGVPMPLQMLVENGRYLSTTSDGNILYARSYLPNSGEDTEQVLKEKLWLLEKNGKKTQLELPDFYSAEKAEMSADGRYIGILDAGIENKVLYVYDMQEKQIHNLGEEGLGNITISFEWDAELPIIYAMSGLSSATGTNAMQLVKYDFAKPQGARVEGIGGDTPGADSKIVLVNAKIYYADKAGTQAGMIYCVDVNTQVRTEVAAGVDFAVSADGNNIASVIPTVQPVAELVDMGNEAMTFDVVITNLATGVQTNVLSGVTGEGLSIDFDANSDVLYVVTPNYEGVTPAYPFAILKYSISTQQLSLLEYSKTENIIPAVNAGERYIIDYYSQNDDSFYVTYVQTEK
ncbi:MAG: hypothetical protein RR632_02495 [Christensenella sp.]